MKRFGYATRVAHDLAGTICNELVCGEHRTVSGDGSPAC